jgi:hypothetical protein
MEFVLVAALCGAIVVPPPEHQALCAPARPRLGGHFLNTRCTSLADRKIITTKMSDDDNDDVFAGLDIDETTLGSTVGGVAPSCFVPVARA